MDKPHPWRKSHPKRPRNSTKPWDIEHVIKTQIGPYDRTEKVIKR